MSTPTPGRFAALARSSPWRWSTLRFGLAQDGSDTREHLRARVRRPDTLRVERTAGRGCGSPRPTWCELDVGTGVCVYSEEIGGSRPGPQHDPRIDAVDEPMPDALFRAALAVRAVTSIPAGQVARSPRCGLRTVSYPRRNVTVYDAWYLALAESLGAELLTADSRLARAAAVRAGRTRANGPAGRRPRRTRRCAGRVPRGRRAG